MKYDPNTLRNITPENMGGLCSLLFVPKEWVAADAELSILDNKMKTPVTLIAGKTWLELKPFQQTLGFQELGKRTPAGTMYEVTIPGMFTGEYQDLNTKQNLFPYHEYVVIYISPQKEKKIIGTSKKGMTFISDFNTGVSASDRHAYTFSFQYNHEQRAAFYPF